MKTEIRDRWTAALRSGQYEQGQQRLKTRQGQFCCLGVLCDVVGFDLDELGELDVTWGLFGGLTYAPPILKDLLDFDTRNVLSGLNDEGATFDTIADWIDSNIAVTE